MTIRYGGHAARLTLIASLVFIAWSPVMGSLALGHPVLLVGPFTLLGGVLLLGGAWMLRGPTYVTLDEHEVVVHAMIGPIKRRFPFAGWGDLAYEGGKLWIVGEGRRKAVPFYRTQARPEDWRAFERFLAEKLAR